MESALMPPETFVAGLILLGCLIYAGFVIVDEWSRRR